MKRTVIIISVIIVAGLIYISFYKYLPPYSTIKSASLVSGLCCQSQSRNLVVENKNKDIVTFYSQWKNEEIIANVTLTDTMVFEVIVNVQGKRYLHEGIAFKLGNETTDLIEDEEGFSYFVDVYEYKKDDCCIYFKVDNESYDKLAITMSNECEQQLPNMFAGVQSGILRRK